MEEPRKSSEGTGAEAGTAKGVEFGHAESMGRHLK